MYPTPISPMLSLGFPALALALLVLLVIGHWWAARALPQTVALVGALGLWGTLVAMAAGSGWLAHFEVKPPPLLVLFVAAMTAGVTLARSVIGKALSAGLPLWVLVGFQSFRVPLELLMHQAAVEQVMPPQMTYTGWNFDIISGLAAAVVAPLVATGRAGPRLVRAWNVLGTLLLGGVLCIALASTPMIRAFGEGVALNTFVAYWPFTTLPTVMVPLALAGHLMLFARLSQKSQRGA